MSKDERADQHFLDEHSITNSLIYELSQLLRTNFYKKFDRIYERALDDFEKYGGRGPLELFQRSLENISRWKKERKIKEYKYLIKSNRIDKNYLNKLINSVHTAYVNEYTHRLNMKVVPDVKIKVPNNITFICKCYENIARELWRKAYLFSRQVTSVARQKNINSILCSIDSSILKTIRDSMPLKEILHISKYAASGGGQEKSEKTEKNEKTEDSEDDWSAYYQSNEKNSSEKSEEEHNSEKSEESEKNSSEEGKNEVDSEKSEEDAMSEMASILGLPINFGGMFRGARPEETRSFAKIEEITDSVNINSSEGSEDNDDEKEEPTEEKKEVELDMNNDEDKELFDKFMKFQQFMRMNNE